MSRRRCANSKCHRSTRSSGPSSRRTDRSASSRRALRKLPRPVPLYLTEQDVEAMLTPDYAVEAIERRLQRMAAGGVHIAPRRRVELEEGRLADMAASDLELGYAGVKAYAGFHDGAAFVVALFAADRPELVAVIEADHLGRLRTGAASAVAAKHL